MNELALWEGQLVDYSFSEDGWMLLALNENGGSSRILTLDGAGKILGEQSLTDRVRSVSASGGCAAVLTDQALSTYDRKLNPMDQSLDTLSATCVIARADGTALLVGSGGTKLFIP